MYNNKNESVSTDMSRFGIRELKMAGVLLSSYKTSKDKTIFLGEGVQLFCNFHSGNVFLSDEDYNTAMMNGDFLEDFFTCYNCGVEGFYEDVINFKDHNGDKDCKAFIKNIK